MSSEDVSRLFFLVVIVAGLYLLIIRPTRRRAREVDSLQRSLTVGAEVMLTSGIFGRVVEIDDDRVEVEVAAGVIVTVHRGAIGKVERGADDDGGDDDDELEDRYAEDLDTTDEPAPDSADSSSPDGDDDVTPSVDSDVSTHTDSESRGAH